jgi:hypothetical protein
LGYKNRLLLKQAGGEPNYRADESNGVRKNHRCFRQQELGMSMFGAVPVSKCTTV